MIPVWPARERISRHLMEAKRPAVLCSFGKDSMVLLHLCRELWPTIDVVMFIQHAEQFPEKYAFAHRIITSWGLACYTLPPRWTVHCQTDKSNDLYSSYGGDTTGPLIMSMGCKPRRGEDPFVCAVDAINHPRTPSVHYPWDVTFIGAKESDPVQFAAAQMTFSQESVQSGSTRLCFPLFDWTDADIWDYTQKHGLPFDEARYTRRDDRTNPDAYPTCFNCLDTKQRGKTVHCPKSQQMIPSQAQGLAYHEAVVEQLLTKIDYGTIVPDSPMRRQHARWMRPKEQWPLFSVEKRIMDGLVYLHVDNVVPLAAQPGGLRAFRKEWIRLERRCREVGIAGWIAGIAANNPKMLRAVLATGAKVFHEDPIETWVVKYVGAETAAPSFREMVKLARASAKELAHA